MGSEHVSKADLTCNCGCGRRSNDEKLVQSIETLWVYVWIKTKVRCKIHISCTVRCYNHNKKYSKYINTSRHLPKYHDMGEGAADMWFEGISIRKLRKYAKELWKKKTFSGLGLYKNFIHIDNSTRRKWGRFWGRP